MSWIDDIKKSVVDSLKSDIEQLSKGTIDDSRLPEGAPKNNDGELIGRKAMLTDPFYDHAASNYFLTKNKISRVTNRTLREMSMRDWLINAILQIRTDTAYRFTRPQTKKFEMGYRFFLRDTEAHLTTADIENIRRLEDYVYNCGRTENVPVGDQMNFGEFIKLAVWDALSIGYISVEKVLTRSGGLHRFRPLPAETVYRANPTIDRNAMDAQAKLALETYQKKRSNNDPTGDGQLNTPEYDYFKYVQVSVDGRSLNVFGDEDMVFKLFNPKNFPDSNGYSVSMVEQAIIMITNHLNVESFNANFFTHGYAARGILHLKGTVTQNTLASFRRQFYNSISGSSNAWRTPIVAGLDDVAWVPMSGSAREMEYINFNSHIMRSICAQFQIDPIEVGLDYLTSSNGRAASSAKESGQFKITYSRERGLLPILMFFEDFINNDIIPVLDKSLAQKYLFKFVGYTDETAQTDISLRQAQMTVFSSMNDLLRNEEKRPIDHPVGDLPLNQNFWALAEKNMTRGEIREVFFKDKGAAERKELAYLPADPAFLSWNQLLLTVDAQKKQAEAQKEQMEQQVQAQEQQSQQEQAQSDREHSLDQSKDKREQEAHEHEIEARKAAAAHAAVHGGSAATLQELAEQFGKVGASNVDGKVIANPMNALADMQKPNK